MSPRRRQGRWRRKYSCRSTWFAELKTRSHRLRRRESSSIASEARTNSTRDTLGCGKKCSMKWGKRWCGRTSLAGSPSISDVPFEFGLFTQIQIELRGDMAQSEQVGIIGKGIVIKGNLTGAGDLVIEGRVEG